MEEMKINKKIVVISSVTLLLLIIIGVSLYIIFHKNNSSSSKGNIKSVSTKLTITPTSEPVHNMLNGTLITQDQFNTLMLRRPLAVMIPNSPDARPQSGVNEADVVYEALTEGPVTRFMAIYWSDQGDFKLMPVRSIRAYFLNWLLEYNDIIVMHTGYASTDNPATNALAILKNYNIKTLIWDYPWAYDDKCKASGTPVWDCAYTDSIKLWNTAQGHKWTGSTWKGVSDASQWKFKDSALPTTSSSGATVAIPFLYKNDYSQTYWNYDTSTNEYLREDSNHKPQLDANNNTQINTKTLVVEQVPFLQTHDEKDRSEQNVVGQGKAYVFEDGKEVTAIWKKADITSRTLFYDLQGNEIAFNRGRIWISVIPDTQSITYK